MVGLIVSLVIVATVIGVLIYRNNQKKIESDAAKVQEVLKSTSNAVKKL
jgi:hypothetical protein